MIQIYKYCHTKYAIMKEKLQSNQEKQLDEYEDGEGDEGEEFI